MAEPPDLPTADQRPPSEGAEARGSAREQEIQHEQTAMSKRPWRIEFFELITRRLESLASGRPRVLELGAGPGFLARYVLEQLPALPHYVLLDFSSAMQETAKQRLGPFSTRASFLERDFKQPTWSSDLGPFDAVVTVQAIHALRHKRYVSTLHAQVRSMLAPQGIYLMCDHRTGPGGMSDDERFMSSDEQERSLREAGFSEVELLSDRGGMVLYLAR